MTSLPPLSHPITTCLSPISRAQSHQSCHAQQEARSRSERQAVPTVSIHRSALKSLPKCPTSCSRASPPLRSASGVHAQRETHITAAANACRMMRVVCAMDIRECCRQRSIEGRRVVARLKVRSAKADRRMRRRLPRHAYAMPTVRPRRLCCTTPHAAAYDSAKAFRKVHAATPRRQPARRTPWRIQTQKGEGRKRVSCIRKQAPAAILLR